jgi:hypothetical protein
MSIFEEGSKTKNPRANVSSGRPPAGRHCPWEPTALHVAVTVTAFGKHKNKLDARKIRRNYLQRKSRFSPENHDSIAKSLTTAFPVAAPSSAMIHQSLFWRAESVQKRQWTVDNG